MEKSYKNFELLEVVVEKHGRHSGLALAVGQHVQAEPSYGSAALQSWQSANLVGDAMKIFFKDSMESQIFRQEFERLAPHLAIWQMSCTENYWTNFRAIFIITRRQPCQ